VVNALNHRLLIRKVFTSLSPYTYMINTNTYTVLITKGKHPILTILSMLVIVQLDIWRKLTTAIALLTSSQGFVLSSQSHLNITSWFKIMCSPLLTEMIHVECCSQFIIHIGDLCGRRVNNNAGILSTCAHWYECAFPL